MIQDACYTAPSGKEIYFSWETGKRTTRLKTGVFEFPGRDGAHVQHQGAGARSFPLICIFSGSKCMQEADTFEAVLIERGVGELQHPIYGTVKVIPTGDIEREDDPVNRNGESTVAITFTETITGEESGQLNEVAAQSIGKKWDWFSAAAVFDFANYLVSFIDKVDIGLKIGRLALRLMKLPSTVSISAFEKIGGYTRLIAGLISQYANYPFEIVSDLKKSFTTMLDSLIKSYDDFIAPLISSEDEETLTDWQSSKKELISIKTDLNSEEINQTDAAAEIVDATYAMATLAITGACASVASGVALAIADAAAESSAPGGASSGTGMGGNGAASGSDGIDNSVETTGANSNSSLAVNKSVGTTSREDAIEIANQIAALLDTVTDFQDKKIAQNSFVDASPTTHLELTDIVYSSIQLILNASFALPMQKTITLDRDRQVVELCAELYGTTDYLDNFIIENNFNIDELEILPMGKKVSYYVKST